MIFLNLGCMFGLAKGKGKDGRLVAWQAGGFKGCLDSLLFPPPILSRSFPISRLIF